MPQIYGWFSKVTMAASRAVLTSFEWSARSRSRVLRCSSVDCRGTILIATYCKLIGKENHLNSRAARTCSPLSIFLASLTLPMLPAPMVFPRVHTPVWAAMVVLRLMGREASWVETSRCRMMPLWPVEPGGREVSVLYRGWPDLESLRCDALIDSLFMLGGGAAWGLSFDLLRVEAGRIRCVVS